MNTKTYAVMGASGHIGRVLSERLLAEGHEVRALGRSAEKLKPLAAKGAKLHIGAFDDVPSLTQAFAGCDGVFTMIPPDMMVPDYRTFQDQVGETIAQALAQAKTRQVVNLSSVGGELSEKNGVIQGLHFQEERLNALPDVSVVHLRPVSFMENLLWDIPLIKAQGIWGGFLKPEFPVEMIATRDIANRGADVLLHLDFSGKSLQELLGQRDLTMTEVAAIVGSTIGKPDLKYVPFSYDDIGKAMTGMGMSSKTISLFLEMYRSINERVIKPTEPRSKKNTTPTSIEIFASEVFLPAWR